MILCYAIYDDNRVCKLFQCQCLLALNMYLRFRVTVLNLIKILTGYHNYQTTSYISYISTLLTGSEWLEAG